MKKITLAFGLAFLTTLNVLTVVASDKPVQHLQLEDITTLDEAKRVFSETTAQIESKNKLDADELHDIHIITYSLEKAVAYFAENSTGEQQVTAKKMAEVVELVHLGSENNRAEETKVYLIEYFKLADKFSKGLSAS